VGKGGGAGGMNRQAERVAVRVWDLPTRLFHWALVVLLAVSYVTGQMGRLDWHMLSGKLILALLLFRLIWGFVGGRHARFAAFLKGPGETLSYLGSLLGHGARRYLGHNPAGGWSAVAMLAVAALQGVTGLFATDDIYTDGPLRYLVSEAMSARLTTVHKYAVNVLLALVALHVLAVLFYLLVKKENLAAAMVTGDKMLEAAAGVESAPAVPAWRAPAVLALSLAIVLGGLWLYGK
jgi:cytochrome b